MEAGKLLVVIGLLLVLAGLLLWLAPAAFSWFGRLPGDIRLERDGIYVYIPITSMVLLSLGLTLLLNLIGWLIRLFHS
ncbi:DUF2905 domain-containing protein [Oceanithermus sp.]